MQTDSGKFPFVFVVHGAGIRSATYLCLDCTKKNWNIHVNVSFIVHVNFDLTWAEQYNPIILTASSRLLEPGTKYAFMKIVRL